MAEILHLPMMPERGIRLATRELSPLELAAGERQVWWIEAFFPWSPEGPKWEKREHASDLPSFEDAEEFIRGMLEAGGLPRFPDVVYPATVLDGGNEPHGRIIISFYDGRFHLWATWAHPCEISAAKHRPGGSYECADAVAAAARRMSALYGGWPIKPTESAWLASRWVPDDGGHAA